MAPTVVPEDMGHIAIAMVDTDRVRDNMQSAIPSGVASQAPSGSIAASSSEDGIQEVPSEAEVRFCFSAVETLFHIRCHLRSLYYGIDLDIARHLCRCKAGEFRAGPSPDRVGSCKCEGQGRARPHAITLGCRDRGVYTTNTRRPNWHSECGFRRRATGNE